MKYDRMAAFEAPRSDPLPERPTEKITLRFLGRYSQSAQVSIPRDMPKPDLLIYRGKHFVRRPEGGYSEAVTWPILEDLDAIK